MENLTIIRKPMDYGAEFTVGRVVNGRKYWMKSPIRVLQALLDDTRVDVDKLVRRYADIAAEGQKFA